jgi:hypothetical protein
MGVNDVNFMVTKETDQVVKNPRGTPLTLGEDHHINAGSSQFRHQPVLIE